MTVVSDKLVLGNSNEVLFHVLGGILVVALILSFSYYSTKLICKATPIDAIRQGQTGERYKRNNILKRAKWAGKNESFMALSDILSNPRRYLSIVISFGFCTLFVLMLVNTMSTINSSKLIKTLGVETDLYITDVDSQMEYMMTCTKEEFIQALDDMSDKLAAENMPNTMCCEAQYKYPVTFMDKDFLLQFQQGINTEVTDYEYTEGEAPRKESEIAITKQVSEKTGARIGDVITIHFAGQDMECMVTAYFQTLNNYGDLVRLHEDAPTDFKNLSSLLQYQVDFTDNPTADEVELRKGYVKEILDMDKIENATEFCTTVVGVAETLGSVQMLLLMITLVVVILVTILMERSFISEEKNQIALLKAIGFRDSAIIKWHVIRFGVVSLLAVLLAAILSIPMTKLLISPIFGLMGASKIDFNILPMKIFGYYPGMILVMTILVTFVTALYTKTIKSSDMANME